METPTSTTPHPPVRLLRINAGSCNGCDTELAATASVARFDVARLGCAYTESPANAQIVLITGPLTTRALGRVLERFAEVPEPKVTVGVGICPVSGGVFRDSYAVAGPADRYLPVDINIPGCPPHPEALLEGIGMAVGLLGERRGRGGAERGTVIPQRRGGVSFNPAACVVCRMCAHVCAGGAIRFHESGSGTQLTLWHNSCADCGLCSHYCPTGALTAGSGGAQVHGRGEMFQRVESGVVPLVPCSGCGSPMVPVAPQLLRVAYRGVNREIERLQTLCQDCRQIRSIGGTGR